MRRIAIANRKGGTGKSTTAVHLAAGLAEMDCRVLLIDADPQGNCAKMLGVHPDYRLEHVLDGEIGETLTTHYVDARASTEPYLDELLGVAV